MSSHLAFQDSYCKVKAIFYRLFQMSWVTGIFWVRGFVEDPRNTDVKWIGPLWTPYPSQIKNPFGSNPLVKQKSNQTISKSRIHFDPKSISNHYISHTLWFSGSGHQLGTKFLKNNMGLVPSTKLKASFYKCVFSILIVLVDPLGNSQRNLVSVRN